MFNYHPPSHLQHSGWRETPEKPAKLGEEGGVGAGQKACTYPRSCACMCSHFTYSESRARWPFVWYCEQRRQELQGCSANAVPHVSEKRAAKLHVRLSGLYTSKYLWCRPLKPFSNCDYLEGRCSFIMETELSVKMSFFHLLPIVLWGLQATSWGC